MKTTIYILIAIFILGIFATNYNTNSRLNNQITIQATISNPSNKDLSKSAEIIQKRMKTIGSGEFQINTIIAKGQIQLTFDNSWSISEVKNLMVQKGRLEFYETFKQDRLMSILKNDSSLFALFNHTVSEEESSKLGCISIVDMQRIYQYINNHNIDNQLKFVWDNLFESSTACLYALKLDKSGNALLNESDISNFKLNQTKESKTNYIEFSFNDLASNKWANITKRNINMPIAITLDDVLIYLPIVRSEIKGGNCQLSGSFNHNQLNYIYAIISNGKMPLGFKIVN